MTSSMLAALRLEERGICVRHPYRYGAAMKWLGRSGNRRPWVARIVGTCLRYKFEREFLTPYIDYRDASRTGRSGIFHHFLLAPGVYDVLEVMNSTKTRRFFARSEGGHVVEVEREEIDEWLRKRDQTANMASA